MGDQPLVIWYAVGIQWFKILQQEEKT